LNDFQKDLEKKKMKANVPGSFRDPSGHLYYSGGLLYRQINTVYRDNYEKLMRSGLYEQLVQQRLLIPHVEVGLENLESDEVYRIIKPEKINFISYPYEWSFSQLKDAAITTLEIQKNALQFGMSLKDASAYNIQFAEGSPILIDSLSFEKYSEGKPWIAYHQFCQHFLAPLALVSYKDIRLNQLLRIYLDGIPLDLASSLLPTATLFRFSMLFHIHLHSKSQQHFADKKIKKTGRKISRRAFEGLIDSLKSSISRLRWKPKGTEWADYYDDTNYSDEGLRHKKEIVADFLEKANPYSAWDFGANLGMFSRIAASRGIKTISFDIDPGAVEKNYLECIAKNEKDILPLLIDLTNPSPAIGWENRERMTLLERSPVEMVLALALVHHLAITNNVPIKMIASFLYEICRWLIIEFIPKNDSQVLRLLRSREDIFPNYSKEAFEFEFKQFFKIRNSVKIKGSERTLYLMEKLG
jgi:ribosomal protein L11 methylase PrmA